MSGGATIALEHVPAPATTLPPVPVDVLKDAIRQVVREVLLEQRTRTDVILTLEEAKAYTKKESDSAFYRWASERRLTSTSPGRYARSQLDRALLGEAGVKRQPKPAPRRQAVAA